MLTKKVGMLLVLTVATPLLFAACTDNGIFNPNQNASGNYQLTVYSGRSIPAHFTIQPNDPLYPEYPNGATFDVTSGNLALSSNGTFVETNNFVVTPTGSASQSQSFTRSGTWTINFGTDLTLFIPAQNNNPSETLDATLDVDTITYQEADASGTLQSYEYKR
jgi:hypothetical protein